MIAQYKGKVAWSSHQSAWIGTVWQQPAFNGMKTHHLVTLSGPKWDNIYGRVFHIVQGLNGGG